ncbi:MAG TPA: hypothetical protein VED20_16530 [Streptosporangiaceae bacterium]|nr:hypothetical protein [Streptosporangiaceae bacterium]
MKYDLVVRSRRTVLPEGTRAAAVAVSGPSIAAIESYGERLDAVRDVDVGDLALLPGLVDTHMHYAGRTLTGRVRQAWLRGISLLEADSGAPDGEPVGRLLNRG